MLRKIAIVGANGFVGRHTMEMARCQGISVVGVVRSEAAFGRVRALGADAVQVKDLSAESTQALLPHLGGCDGLVYTASVSKGPGAPDRTDPSGLINVLGACREAGVSRVVYFSGLGIAHYGMNHHCTNPYFLAKMAGEVELFRSGLSVTILRPSYIFGPGDEFLTPLIHRMRTSAVIEVPGDGEYRLQPISVRDAARVVLGAFLGSAQGQAVLDLVGPEILSYRQLIARVATRLGCQVSTRERPKSEAMSQAGERGGYFGLRPHDLDCLFCDEVSVPGPVECLTSGPLETLDEMIDWTLATEPLVAPES